MLTAPSGRRSDDHPAGQSTTLSLAFTMHVGMGGAHEFIVPLRANDPAAPERTLSVRSYWGP